MKRFFNEFKFFLERLLLRGAHYQLLIIAVLICLVSLIAGLLAFFFTPRITLAEESAMAQASQLDRKVREVPPGKDQFPVLMS